MNYIFFHLLYALSAFCFAIISCRYTILSLRNLKLAFSQNELPSIIIAGLLCLCLLTISWLGLPYFFYLRSKPALYVYAASLFFFLALSHQKNKK